MVAAHLSVYRTDGKAIELEGGDDEHPHRRWPVMTCRLRGRATGAVPCPGHCSRPGSPPSTPPAGRAPRARSRGRAAGGDRRPGAEDAASPGCGSPQAQPTGPRRSRPGVARSPPRHAHGSPWWGAGSRRRNGWRSRSRVTGEAGCGRAARCQRRRRRSAVARVKPPAGRGPSAGVLPARRGRRECAFAAETRASCGDGGCWAGRCACSQQGSTRWGIVGRPPLATSAAGGSAPRYVRPGRRSKRPVASRWPNPSACRCTTRRVLLGS